MDNIYPEFERMLGREAKEQLLRQRGCLVWCYGMSGSGKSTLVNALERELHAAGRMTQILDGDNVRTGLNKNLGFSDEDRSENIRRIAEVAKLFVHAGIITLASFICPHREMRRMAKDIVGHEDFLEVYVKASYETCAARDPKGLYAKVAAGKVGQFTGKDSNFEEPLPEDGATIIETEGQALTESLAGLRQAVAQRFKIQS